MSITTMTIAADVTPLSKPCKPCILPIVERMNRGKGLVMTTITAAEKKARGQARFLLFTKDDGTTFEAYDCKGLILRQGFVLVEGGQTFDILTDDNDPDSDTAEVGNLLYSPQAAAAMIEASDYSPGEIPVKSLDVAKAFLYRERLAVKKTGSQ